MRDIKFRVWCKHNKEMYDEYFGVDIDQPDVILFGNEDKERWATREEVVLMQKTGLKDMNDKNIYEGDIVRVFDVQTGKLSENAYTVIYNSKSEWTIDDYYLLSRKHHKCKIIGNIYENQELF